MLLKERSAPRPKTRRTGRQVLSTRNPAHEVTLGRLPSDLDVAAARMACNDIGCCCATLDMSRRLASYNSAWLAASGFGLLHDLRHDDGELEVLHKSANGESFGSLAQFEPHEREEAIAFALCKGPKNGACRLGGIGS